MAHFIGTAQGGKGKASRLGTKTTGITAYAASWAGGLEVRITFDKASGRDRFTIYQRKHEGAGVIELVAEGFVGELISHKRTA
jgi:hypothetical protein